MLIDKGFTKNDIVSLKLLNGDEIIARFESETATEIKIDRPLAVTVTGQGLGLIPWIFFGDKDIIVLQKSHVFAMIPSKKDAAGQYQQGTTNIALL
jgi:hypothetical protein